MNYSKSSCECVRARAEDKCRQGFAFVAMTTVNNHISVDILFIFFFDFGATQNLMYELKLNCVAKRHNVHSINGAEKSISFGIQW